MERSLCFDGKYFAAYPCKLCGTPGKWRIDKVSVCASCYSRWLDKERAARSLVADEFYQALATPSEEPK
jgi:transcription elongation factor Elf1